MLQHLEALKRAVGSIKHPYEEPNFVFMPEAFHDINPFKIHTSEFFMPKLFFYFLLLSGGAVLGKVLSEYFFGARSASTNRSELLLKMKLQQLCQNSRQRNFI